LGRPGERFGAGHAQRDLVRPRAQERGVELDRAEVVRAVLTRAAVTGGAGFLEGERSHLRAIHFHDQVTRGLHRRDAERERGLAGLLSGEVEADRPVWSLVEPAPLREVPVVALLRAPDRERDVVGEVAEVVLEGVVVARALAVAELARRAVGD